MTLIDLGEPTPRTEALSVQHFEYTVDREILLDPPEIQPQQNVFRVLEQRQTRRDFRTLTYNQVSQLLWYSIKRRSAILDNGQYIWQHAPTPSAGGCYPIDVLITEIGTEPNEVFLYDPIGHSLARISKPNEEARGVLAQMAMQCVTAKSLGTLIWFAAQPNKTYSRYSNPGSLIWRDSGALLATIGIVAEALCFNCCALGPTGNPWIGRMVDGRDLIVGIGGCMVGSAPDKTNRFDSRCASV